MKVGNDGVRPRGAAGSRGWPAVAAAERRPALSRQAAAGTDSARGLLFTLLGELVLPGDGTAWTSAVIAALARLEVEEKTTRQALLRAAAGGWLEAEKIGRRTRWRLTGSARHLLTQGAARIYSFNRSTQAWDGRWLVVCARVPDSDRRARNLLRSRLGWAGFGSLAPGLWISPHASREAEAIDVLRTASVDDAQIFVATRSEFGDVRQMVTAAWNLPAIEEQYQRFMEDFCSPGVEDVLARLIALVHVWRRFPSIDPAVPRELLPARWSGLEAARLFAERRRRWSDDARRDWEHLNGSG